MFNLIRFLFSRRFLINLGIAIVLIVVSFIIINQKLKSYTRHGQEIEVPDFRGHDLNELQELSAAQNFRLKVIDSLYDAGMEPGAVIHQNPKPGSLVKENRTIYLTINMHSPPIVLLPPLVNQSSRQVEATIHILGLNVREKKFEPSPYENLVLDVLYNGESVAEGAEVPLNSELDLIIGTNNNLPWVVMPDIRNLKPAKADTVLMDAGLNLGRLIDCSGCYSGKDSTEAVIYKTNPQYKPDKKVRLGSSIDYWISPEPVDSLPIN